MTLYESELLDLIATEALVDRSKLLLDAQLDSLGIDSVDFVSIIFAVEERYGVSIEDDEIKSDKTLGDMVALIENKIETLSVHA